MMGHPTEILDPPEDPRCPVAKVTLWHGRELSGRMPVWNEWFSRCGFPSISLHPAWMKVLEKSMGHEPYCLEAERDGQVCGLLPLVLVKSWIFGRHLVGLPYLNTGGVLGADAEAASQLLDRAAQLADQLNVKHLQLRHEEALRHPRLGQTVSTKLHMRLALPASVDELWDSLKAKVRNQIRNAERKGVSVRWGGSELLPAFYEVFSENMRDLGTPVYPVGLFRTIFEQFPGQVEICLADFEGQTIAGAFLLQGPGVSEVPSASSLRKFNSTNANMLMYWHQLKRAVELGKDVFDFGRSTEDSATYRFKKQWGAEPSASAWQYYVRQGSVGDLRLESGKFDLAVEAWKKLPLAVSRWVGPCIVRGIP